MAEHDCKSDESISKTERHLRVRYRANGFFGARTIPQVSFSGQCLEDAGFTVGTCVTLRVLDGCLLLTPEVKQRRAQGLELRRLDRQLAELRRAKKRISKALG